MTKPSTPQAAQALRDARLAKALQHAPDADALPSPALRSTIKTIAANAIGESARGQLRFENSRWRAWWHSLWASTGSARGPWGGALATLVLGCIITAMWYGQEVPDEKVRYSGEAAKVVSAEVAAPAPAPAPMQERAATAAPLAKSAAQEAMPAAKMKATVRSEEPATPAAPTVFADKSKEQAANDVAAESRAADASKPVAAQATNNAAPMAAPAATASAPVASGLVGSLRKSRTTAPIEWHSTSVQYQGRTTQLAAADAKQLDVYVRAVVNSATPLASGENPTAAAAPVLRIVLSETDANTSGAQAVFTLWPGGMQWQRAGQADVLGAPQADALAALLAHVRSLPK